jgi:hypothetical protein
VRAESAKLWGDFLEQYSRIHVYTVDPGAHAIAIELVPFIERMGRLAGWHAEGWSERQKLNYRPVAELGALAAGDTLILGSQTNFDRTKAMICNAISRGAHAIFVFDHWKNFSEHFGSASLPDAMVVPDSIARDLLLAELGESATPRVKVLPHLAFEAATDRVRSYGTPSVGIVALLLDPTEVADGLGYDWKSALAAAVDLASKQDRMRVVVKPHPRQNVEAVERELAKWRDNSVRLELFQGEVERLIAEADEVWGMTTVALNVALAVGKPIRSLQIGRNDKGRRASNPHIEPFAMTETRKAR